MFIEGKRIGMEEASNRPLYYNMLACRARTDAAAFSELYDYFFPRTYNFIYGRTKNRDAADEIISVVFEKLFLHLADYEAEKAAFSTWLFRIAQNAIHDFYRRQGARHETSWEEFFDPGDSADGPEQQVLRREGNEELLRALDGLKEGERELIALKYWSGLSNKEIAVVTGRTENSVGVALHRAIGKLKKWMPEEG